MSVETTALLPFLRSDAGVNLLVGNRIAPAHNKQNQAAPRVTYQRISTQRPISSDGPSTTTTARVQFTCWGSGSDGYGDAARVAAALRNAVGTSATATAITGHTALHGFAGTMGGMTIQGAWFDEDRDGADGPQDADDGFDFSVITDLIITFVEI